MTTDKNNITNQIPRELYQQIHAMVPIACVDIVLKNGNFFLLAKRINKPAQGQWFLLGGRILKNEKLEDAARRKILQETSINVTIERMLGADETMFLDGPFGDSTHTVNIVFLATPTNPENLITLDNQNSGYQWFSNVDDAWHPYVKKFLGLAGFDK